MSQSLLYKTSVRVNDNISITIPTVEQVLENYSSYYTMVSILTSMPIDLMVELDDIGIDFTKIDEYELFLIMFSVLKTQNTSLVFGDLDLSNFEIETNSENGLAILYDAQNDIIIDRSIYEIISNILREIHNLTKNYRKPANKEAKEFMIKRARAKMKRRSKVKEKPHLESLIVAMVNTEQFKYNLDSVRKLTIYQFNECVQQIIKKIDYDNTMHGVYAGTLNAKELSQYDLSWLIHK